MLSKLFILFFFVLNSCVSQKQHISEPLKGDTLTYLTGNWEVISIENKSDLIKKPTMMFSENNQVDGNAGCNNYGGEYTIKDENILFSKVMSTMMICFDDDIENRFFSALSKVKKIKLNGDQIQLFDDKKNVVMVLQNTKKQKEITRIIYQANSRGFFKEIIVSKDTAVIKNNRDSHDNIRTKISKNDWDTCLELLSKINIDELPKLKAPTSKRLYDGAAHASITIEKYEGKVTSSTFDHGHPPKTIKTLTELLLSFEKK